MGSQPLQDGDYRSRFESFRAFDLQRSALVESVLARLDAVTAELEAVTKAKERDVSLLMRDLESEKEARRGWQEKGVAMRERLSSLEQARFVLVLIDADADIYIFREEYLSRGLAGGQDAADRFMEKVREHLASLGTINEPKSVPVMVKAFANLTGLAHACVRDKKVKSAGDLAQFWIGFSRRYALVDFVDVGPGKEEADNKIREILGFHFGNPQCEHILLACCHDTGYIPVLRQYAAQSSYSDRLTLLSAGPFRSDINALGFRNTASFESLFRSSPNSSPRSTQSAIIAKDYQQPLDTIQQTLDAIVSTSSSSAKEKAVSNSGRLRPVLRNVAGKRVDKNLNADANLIQEMKKLKLCSWHHLRSDCQLASCKRNHDYPRPLCPAEYDALWMGTRQGVCRRLRKDGDCNDDQCIYGHGFN